MKIALLTIADSVHGTRWANAFAERQHEVHLLTSHEPANPLSRGVTLHRLPFRHPVGYFLNAAHVRKLLSKIAPDVLSTHFASGYGTLARLSNFQPNVLSVWGTDVYEFPHKSPWHRRLIEKNLRKAQQLCSTSHVMAAETKQLVPDLPFHVVPFGIDTELFRPHRRETAGDALVIGTVKTLSPTYGIDLLIQAFALLHKRLEISEPELARRLQLKIVGGGPDLMRLKHLADSLGVAPASTFVARVEHHEVVKQLNSLDIYVALSRRESFGVAILEASACELPVLVSDVGGLPEVVDNGVTGLIVPNENVEAAASALLKLVKDRHMRKNMGLAGRQLVCARYEWSHNVEQMERILEAAAARGSG